VIFRVFLPDFSSVSLEEFFFDSFFRFGCYDEPHYLSPPWSESMALDPSISWISPRSPKT
jgi:hypothetical protein